MNATKDETLTLLITTSKVKELIEGYIRSIGFVPKKVEPRSGIFGPTDYTAEVQFPSPEQEPLPVIDPKGEHVIAATAGPGHALFIDGIVRGGFPVKVEVSPESLDGLNTLVALKRNLGL